MKIIRYKKQGLVVLHLLFWLISINVWYNVFNPAIDSTGAIRGMNELWPRLLLVNSLLYLFILLPFVLFIRKIPKWVKIMVSIIFLIPVIYLVFQWFFPAGKKDEFSFLWDSLISGFIYSVVFHLTIAAAVYLNLKILIPRFLTQGRFGLYIVSVISLAFLASVLNFAFFDCCIDKIFPSLFFISCFKVWELVLIVGAYLLLTTLVYIIGQYASMLKSRKLMKAS